VKLQGRGRKVENYCTNVKALTQGIHMCNMKVFYSMVVELWPRF